MSPQMIANGAREASDLHRLLSVPSLIAVRFSSALGAYFIVSVCFALLNSLFSFAHTLSSFSIRFSVLPSNSKLIARKLIRESGSRITAQVGDFRFGRTGFLVFWMMNFWGMSAV
jgi:hypothetical protein